MRSNPSPKSETFITVEKAVSEYGTGKNNLVRILRHVQEHLNFLSEEALRCVSELAQIPLADVVGVATFYSQFRLTPAGKHRISVCVGTACYIKGATELTKAFKRNLGIAENEDTDADRLFTVEEVACLGCCMLACAVRVGEVTYGYVTPEKSPQVLRDYLNSLASPHEPALPANSSATKNEIRLCLCSSCTASGAAEIQRELLSARERLGINFNLKTVGCTGESYNAPLIEISTGGKTFRYGTVRKEVIEEILTAHFSNSAKPESISQKAASLLENLYSDFHKESATRYLLPENENLHTPSSTRQVRMVTEFAGTAEPLDLDEYIRLGGFEALKKAVAMTPQEILNEIKESGLRGRGGAGFPSWRKWDGVRQAEAKQKYIICNGDEGDPGAFMDRMILESFPFRVIEGLAIAAYCVGATSGRLYVRCEYPLAEARMRRAISLCEEKDLLGDNILQSDFSLHLDIEEGAGAFVCGEETALISAIEGERGNPRARPPFPSEKGLNGCPTLVNNVETVALVPWIIRNGASSFNALGTENSKGTKTFALAGKVKRGGLVEIPMGLTLRQIVEEVGHGVPEGKELKAVQVGGPSGGCIPAKLCDTPVDYEALQGLGAIMGSGGLVVLDSDDCMVDVARYFMAFTQSESCGKCAPCRIGTRRMLQILDNLCEGRGRKGDIEELEKLARQIKQTSLCGLGKSAPNPILSTLRHFREEYESHIEGKCPAGKCRNLISYEIDDSCIGCTLCAQNCPADAIADSPLERQEIDQEKCVRCGGCATICPVKAVKLVQGRIAPVGAIQ